MLRLHKCIVAQLLPHASAISPLHRLLSAAATPARRISPNPSFVVDDYLVSACGLTRAQALKASPKLSHLKSPAKPDAVLAFLAGLGLSAADVATAVAKDPLLLRAKVEGTLAPVVDGLTGLGLSRSEVARIAVLVPGKFRCRSIVSAVHYYLNLFGSMDNLLRLLKRGFWLQGSDVERVVKPNVAFLQECGLHDCDIAKLCIRVPMILTINQQRLRAMVACAKALCVPHGSGMLRKALQAVGFCDEEKITAKVEYLKKTFRWSDTEVGIALPKNPMVLTYSKDRLQRVSEFLISEVGLEPGYIAHRPALLAYSLDGRLRPRYYVVKFLKENRLLHGDRDYYSAVAVTPKVFMEKFICPHKEAAPHLAEDYAAACRGEVPARFRFT
ncbi:hypothetical protein CFC21_090888 [Triticum aestivum]|uniref:mTERF domain-containing protein 1, mitochondrial n=6 Tax=Triticinae TaxID=1648030 RepID=A0A453MQZ1_AEGTS|nr:transcription termination factor MTERF8, chloroplastic [Aegilops tauschii subsp. strangulata]XP_044417684.1 transcription termination factor MTERF8, chloroplastic-like [Triticum aestivum]XP_044417685.1 transcription termination factor MTERF8, chloroplastic-like [Triticum aestivum]XP_044417686.1 transcription termination factor MTERF8, chloroplastic-like [Triticum aestivum]XP_044417687.1 transcription termination factor MTERF8, chloroplastic-like [Triticum aestivum]XP_044417688.1 transcripti